MNALPQLRNAMTSVLAGVSLSVFGLLGSTTAYGQPAAPSSPTTRILAIGTVNPGVDLVAVQAILPAEIRSTAALYLDGKIDQWYSIQGRAGVVFILNITDVAVARAQLESLPLGQAHLMTFELLPLGPLGPLRQLQEMAPGR